MLPTHATQLVHVIIALISSECSSPNSTTRENVTFVPAASMSACSDCSSSCTRTRSNVTSVFQLMIPTRLCNTPSSFST
ncbi:hypothetical protein PF010_g18423 [Phytophthora fragariae]|uniref:Secreted protein n=1 Tax=Phytophthora fragariae TaxID=53985 RepID=A0A6A4CIW0_9STRA|nr:hypothetical protein PF003_g33190 [Phytophthora fragariae]KAE8929395.1 hypothetical protein PF009_g20485 [Phytophthora fragariae]KAE9089444.1 hypothetical protein PF007_g19596 [Phytophthora fragariae]KAE9090867.1 hypothetical protein PF010_g18423 [Phytophthora fragariae]KAE9217581.1 hypothetical protein PF002_g16750 [Phytophthora fragariae]